MEKAARKALEKQLIETILTQLKSKNEIAASKTVKIIKESAKAIAKKFAKAKNGVETVKAKPLIAKPGKSAIKKPGAKVTPRAARGKK